MYAARAGTALHAVGYGWRVMEVTGTAMLLGWIAERVLDAGIRIPGIGAAAGVCGYYFGAWLWDLTQAALEVLHRLGAADHEVAGAGMDQVEDAPGAHYEAQEQREEEADHGHRHSRSAARRSSRTTTWSAARLVRGAARRSRIRSCTLPSDRAAPSPPSSASRASPRRARSTSSTRPSTARSCQRSSSAASARRVHSQAKSSCWPSP